MSNPLSLIQVPVPPGCLVGQDCRIGQGVVLCAGLTIGDAVRIDPNAVFVEADGDATLVTRVRDGVRIGANATIYPGVEIGAKALIRPGAVVTHAVPPKAIVEGNPAMISGYVDTEAGPPDVVPTVASVPARPSVIETPVAGVKIHLFPVIPDLRGNLTVGEFDRQIPFKPLRYFMVFGVPSREIRGEHAHRACHQFLICVRGSCALVADDGQRRMEVVLDSPNKGLHLPPMTWGIQYKYSADALLLVFASHYYDPADYIRDYAEFLRMVGAA